MADLVYHSIRIAMRTVLNLFSTWQVEGLENIPPAGPLLVAANHMSYIDPPLLTAGLPRRLYTLGKGSMFRPWNRWILKAWGAFPVDRDGRDLKAFHWAQRLLNQGRVVAMFPETTRSVSGMRKAISGVALLALRTQVPVLPVGIVGTAHLGPYWRVAFPTGHITLRIGQPFSLPSIEGRVGRVQLQSMADMIMYRVAAMVPEHQRGVYQLETHTRECSLGGDGPRGPGQTRPN